MTAQPRVLGGRYEIGGMIGYGGMAEVHRGRDIRLGRDVAIKMLRTDLARDETFLTRFRREAHNAATLNHPSIVAVYDTGEDTESGTPVPYIVMEYVEGRTLKEVLAAEGRLTPRRGCEILADVCAALDYSHRHQIIHRDVKPGNVMLATNGQVKVMDFGIARALAAGQATMTQTSAVIGTAQYLSPEQARGETVDARSDVYAVGCLLYELLCGDPPFTGDNPVSVAYQHVLEVPVPPGNHNPDIPPSVDAIALKALEKNPVNRYQSAGEMRDDLERAIAGRPVLAPPAMTQEERTQLINAQRADETRVASVVPDRPAPKRTGRKVAAALIALVLIAGLGFGTYYLLNGNKAQVPDVKGDTKAEATQALEAVELTPDFKEEKSDKSLKGKVKRQDPGPDKEVEKNSTVVVYMGTGPSEVDVPDLTNFSTCPTLEDQVKKAGLKPKCSKVDSDKPEGDLVSQDPEAGTTVKPGTEVTIEVSKDTQAEVPDVTGDSPDEACQTIEDAGFRCEESEELRATSNPDEAGKVVAQEPAGETTQNKEDTTVTVYVGGIEVPDLKGKTVAEARQELEELGLQLDAGDAIDADTVEGHEPAKGKVVEKDSTVTVTVEPGI